MLTNCFTWNDIESALIVCYEKSCNRVQAGEQVLLKQGSINKHNFKINNIAKCQPYNIPENNVFEFVFLCFCFIFSIKIINNKIQIRKVACRLQNLNNILL